MTFAFGVDYYPEHWPEARWAEDADRMRRAGMNVVRVAEFAWCRLEPEEGVYDFAWLDRAVAVLGERGLRVILGTPTAAPPPWLTARYPEVLPQRADGRIVRPGSRHHVCRSSPLYRAFSRKITRRLAEHFRDSPYVFGFQTDNELGCHQVRCYCPRCQAAFRSWLRARYGSVEALNRAWGLVFWSAEVRSWDEVPLPWDTAAAHNPSLRLDFDRFYSDTLVSFHREQAEILREVNPKWRITHNTMGLFRDLDAYALSRELDFVAWDNYPSYAPAPQPVRPDRVALAHDFVRGLKPDVPFWVLEQQSGPPMSARTIAPAPRPGQIRLWTLQSVAHGAGGIVYFRYRTARFGQEQFWHGLLDHHGHEGRRFHEVARLRPELEKIAAELAGGRPEPEVAFWHSYDASWALDADPGHPDLTYLGQFEVWHRAATSLGLTCAVVQAGQPLPRCRAVIAPSWYLVDPAHVPPLAAFAEAGGEVLFTCRSGVKDPHNQVVDDWLPGPLRPLVGAAVEEYDCLPADTRVAVVLEGTSYPAVAWADILRPEGAQVAARYAGDFYAGQAALTERRLGEGRVWYLGTVASEDLARAVLQRLLGPAERLPDGVETVAWQVEGRRLRFVLNHRAQEVEVHLPPGRELLRGERVGGPAVLEPYAVLLVEEQPATRGGTGCSNS